MGYQPASLVLVAVIGTAAVVPEVAVQVRVEAAELRVPIGEPAVA